MPAEKVVNVNVLEERDPQFLVQRYHSPGQVYQGIRKPTDHEKRFHVSPGVTLDRAWSWPVSIRMDSDEEDEVFALIYRDEENLPERGSEPSWRAAPLVVMVLEEDADA
jgi:hypothetical protein